MNDEQKQDPPVEQAPESGSSMLQADNSLEAGNETVGEVKKEEAKPENNKKKGSLIEKAKSRFNVYFLGFILAIVLALVIIFVVIQSNSKQSEQLKNVETQELTQEAIDSLSGNEVTVGDPKQLLSVESNAVFAGKVLIRNGLDVAGPIKVGGDLSLPGITVSGKSSFDEVQANSLSIAGDTSIQGRLTVQDNITINGQGTFAGPVNAPSIIVDALQINGDIKFTRHIDAGGQTPTVSSGSGIGSGGTVTISGTDTAGTVTINVGSSSAGGTLASVAFAENFSENPHVVITPVTSLGSAPISGNANFYLSSRTTSGFTIATSAPLGAGSISFDYVVID